MYFITVPAHIYLNKGLSKTTQNLYGLIISLSSQEGYCYATNKALAEMLGSSVSTISKSLQQLKDKSLIKISLNDLGNTRKIITVDTQNGVKKKPKAPFSTKKKGVEWEEPAWLNEIIDSLGQTDN